MPALPQKKVFRCSFWYLWSRLGLLSVGLVFTGTSISQIATNSSLLNPDHISLFVTVSVAKLFFAALAVLAHIYYFPVITDAHGINGHTARSKKARLEWQEISSMERVRHAGIPCYRLHSATRQLELVVPCCLTAISEFDAVLAGQGIKLAKAETVAPRWQPVRSARLESEPVRQGGYIIISTEQRAGRR